MHFTKTLEELEEHVEKRHIPKELGGDDPWSYRYVEPIPGENKLMSDEATRERLLDERAKLVKDFERTTQQWIHDPKSSETSGQERIGLRDRLRSNYWALDPYLRARTLYDRTGVIREGGRIQFYEPSHDVSKSANLSSVSDGPLPAQHLDDDLD